MPVCTLGQLQFVKLVNPTSQSRTMRLASQRNPTARLLSLKLLMLHRVGSASSSGAVA